MKQLIECVPNFSEGKNQSILDAIATSIQSVEGVKLLDVDAGKDTNRTVFTFVGEPEPVIEAAFRAISTAADLIDMRSHTGAHPRFGATDVCPLIPIANISMEETIVFAQKLGKRVGESLKIPVYLYESAAKSSQRKNLADVRSGEYEGIASKIQKPEWKPDFGPSEFNPKSGNIAIGARDFLLAYNVNLNTTSTRRANNVAFDVREQGRNATIDGTATGKPKLDENGNPIRIPGKCKGVKAIGWYIPEYQLAQVSMNITNIQQTPLHLAFEACYESAFNRGMRVTGSELIGLLPLNSLLEAGRYFLQKQERSIGLSDDELIHIAVKSMGLDELAPFNPKQKIIEYAIAEADARPLIKQTIEQFAFTTASEAPAPGGGSISAYVGSLGVALGAMVANLSSHKRNWEDKWNYFSESASEGQAILKQLLYLVDEDTFAFNAIMDAFGLPKTNDSEIQKRKEAIQLATKNAIHVPFQVMQTAFSAYALLEEMAQNGNPNSASDVGVGAMCIHTAIRGAYMNVLINASGIQNDPEIDQILLKSKQIVEASTQKETTITNIIYKIIQE